MGRIVKGPGRVVPGPVLDAREQAAAIVAAARDQAARSIANAGDLREQARRDGYAEGRAAAAAELAVTVAAARAAADRALAAARPAALAIAGKMAERIVGRAVALAPSVMGEIAAEALAVSRPRGGAVRLRVHPDDLAALEPQRAALLGRAGPGATLELVADAAVGRHGCVVETALGSVDARLEIQIAALQRALAGGGDDRG